MNKQIDIITNFAQDNNVLTKKDEFDGFKPMLKRFMVWDRHNKSFRINNDNDTQVFDMATLISFYMYEAECGIPYTDFDLVQSANLFDKDGKEIFEGSIIDYDGDGAALGVVVSIDGQWQLKDKYGNLMFLKGAPHQKLVGHILSNPELLEEV